MTNKVKHSLEPYAERCKNKRCDGLLINKISEITTRPYRICNKCKKKYNT
jgi:predicted Zn-dependent protease